MLLLYSQDHMIIQVCEQVKQLGDSTLMDDGRDCIQYYRPPTELMVRNESVA